MTTTDHARTRITGRDAIVRAVYDTVVASGFGEVKARQLAEAAGVSPGLIHHHWPNLDALVVEAFELFAQEAADLTASAVDPRSDPRQQLLDLIDALLPDGDAPEVALWVEAACQARRQPALADSVKRTDQALIELVAAILQQGNAQGIWSVPEPDRTAASTVAVIDGLAFHSLVLDSIAPAEARTTASSLISAAIEESPPSHLNRAGLDSTSAL